MYRPVENFGERMELYAMQRNNVHVVSTQLRFQEEMEMMQAMEQQMQAAAAMGGGGPFMGPGGEMYDPQQMQGGPMGGGPFMGPGGDMYNQQQMPPGAMPPGAMPPGEMPPGAMPPGAMPPGEMPAPTPNGAPKGSTPTAQTGGAQQPQPQQTPSEMMAPPSAFDIYSSSNNIGGNASGGPPLAGQTSTYGPSSFYGTDMGLGGSTTGSTNNMYGMPNAQPSSYDINTVSLYGDMAGGPQQPPPSMQRAVPSPGTAPRPASTAVPPTSSPGTGGAAPANAQLERRGSDMKRPSPGDASGQGEKTLQRKSSESSMSTHRSREIRQKNAELKRGDNTSDGSRRDARNGGSRDARSNGSRDGRSNGSRGNSAQRTRSSSGNVKAAPASEKPTTQKPSSSSTKPSSSSSTKPSSSSGEKKRSSSSQKNSYYK